MAGIDAAGVIEWAPFRLRPEVTGEALADASEALQHEFLARQDGFVRRELLCLDERNWVDLVYWRDATAAAAAMQAAASSAVCHTYFHLMEGEVHEGTGVLHLRRVRVY
jgi:hypothetical protein